MRRLFIFIGFLCLLSVHAQGLAASPPLNAFAPPHPVLTVTQKNSIRVVYDVKYDVWDAGIGKDWTADNVIPGVTLVHDAYTCFIDLQQQGYAYIRF